MNKLEKFTNETYPIFLLLKFVSSFRTIVASLSPYCV